MTKDEQRLAWRAYAAAVLTVEDVRMQDVARCADTLLEEERKRFDGPDHSGDANKMVEPREWVGLTPQERKSIIDYWLKSPRPALSVLAEMLEARLREKNGGTR